MDRTPALIRSEMNEARARLDEKLTRLETRARTFTPRRMSQRYLPEYFLDRVIGGVLVLAGLALVWAQRPSRRARRAACDHPSRCRL